MNSSSLRTWLAGHRRVVAIEAGVVLALTAAGLLAPQGPKVWYTALLKGFVGIAGAVLAGAALTDWLANRQASRLQGPRKLSAMRLHSALMTTLAAYIAACFLAWPLARMAVDQPTGLVWTLEEAG